MFLFWGSGTKTQRVPGGRTVSKTCPRCARETTFYECKKKESLSIYHVVEVYAKQETVWQCGDCLSNYKEPKDEALAEPSDAKSFLTRAVSLLQEYKSVAALADANRALEKLHKTAPEKAKALSVRAAAYIQLNRFAKALEDCEELRLLKGNSSALCVLRAQANLGMNKQVQALEDANLAVNSLAQNATPRQLASALNARASVYVRQLEAEKAIADCTKALQSDSSYEYALVTRAHSFCVANQSEKALADLETLSAMTLKPHVRAYMLSNRARVMLRQGDLEAATRDAAAGNAAFDDLPSVLSTLGIVLCRSKRPESALAALNRAIHVNPRCAEAFWFRHETYESIGGFEKARTDKSVAEESGYKAYL